MKRVLKIIMVLLLCIAVAACEEVSAEEVVNVTNASYRNIVVGSFEGTVLIKDENIKDPLQAYEGMGLKDGDYVTVGEQSYLTLDVDSDKHLYVEPNTKFHLVAEGDEESNRTKIILESGSVLCQIKEKLKDDESFEIETVSSTMSVRGTVFRVSLLESSDTNNYEMVEVYDGKVLSNIESSSKEITFEAGQCGLIKEKSDGKDAAFVTDDQIDEKFWKSADTDMKVIKEEGTGSPVLSIAYNKLSDSVVENLVTIVESGQELAIGVDELNDLKEKANDTKVGDNKEG